MAGVSFDRTVENQEIIDLLKLTRNLVMKKKTLDVVTQRHHYPVMNQWFRDDRIQLEGSTMVEKIIVLDNDGTAQAQHVRPFQAIQPSVSDVTAKMTYPLRRLTGHWSIERNEVLACRGEAQLVNIQSVRRATMQAHIANTLEKRGFRAPTDSTDDLNPNGIPYYLPKISTTDAADTTKEAGGHNCHSITYDDGSSTTSTCLGIDASAEKYKLWRSWGGRWKHDNILDDFDAEDVERMISMHMDLHFEVPKNATEWASQEFDQYKAHTTKKLLLAFERYVGKNNDNLGADLGRWSGQTVVKGTPVQWTEELDSWVNADGNVSHTFLLLNHAYFNVAIMEGDYFRPTGPMNDVQTHDVFTNFEDLQYQFIITNRRYCGGRLDVEPMT